MSGVRLTASEFRRQLAELGEALRQRIELEVEAFPADEAAREERRRRALAPDGYRFFAETYFPHYLTAPPSKLHEHLFDALPQMLADTAGWRMALIAPRGSAKSTHVSLIFPLWCLARGAKHYMMIISDAFEQAATLVEAIKAELEVNPRLAHDFPEIAGVGRIWREGQIVTTSNVKIEGLGSGKKVRGRRHGPYRPDLVVLDDVENDENVHSPHQRDKLTRWIDRAVLKLGPPDGSMDVIMAGTVLHHDAVIQRLAKRPGWRMARFAAILRWPDRMDLWERWEEKLLNEGEDAADAFCHQHKKEMERGAELNWPAMQPLEWLMKVRAEGHAAFEAEYQGNPISERSPFRHLTYWVARNPNWLFFGAIDPSLGKRGGRGDPSAILVGGLDPETGVLDVVEASIRVRLPDTIIADALAMQREYRCQLWFVEAVQFQELLRDLLMKEAAKAGIAMPCVPVTPHADKALRIERLQAPVAAGLIRFHPSQTTLIDQLQQWPEADHDDGPDALEMLWTHALQYGQSSISPDVLRRHAARTGGHYVLRGYRL